MGGRGTSSGKGERFGGGRPLTIYDRTKQFEGMSIHEFENKVRDRKNEYLGIFDKEGKLIKAVTSYNHGAVALPAEAMMGGVDVLTHNHPYFDGRVMGGTFSEADVYNSAVLGIRETRAVSNGPGENTYIIKANPRLEKSLGIDNQYEKIASMTAKVASKKQLYKMAERQVGNVQKRLKAQGKTMSYEQRMRVYFGSMKKVWKRVARDAGYDYVEVKEARW